MTVVSVTLQDERIQYKLRVVINAVMCKSKFPTVCCKCAGFEKSISRCAKVTP